MIRTGKSKETGYIDIEMDSHDTKMKEKLELHETDLGHSATALLTDPIDPEKLSHQNGGNFVEGTELAGSIDDDSSEDDENSQCCSFMADAQKFVSMAYSENKRLIKQVLIILGLMIYVAYFMWACITHYKRALPLIAITSLVVLVIIYRLVETWAGNFICTYICQPIASAIKPKWKVIKWCSIIGVVLLVAVLLAVLIGPRYNQYRGLAGLAFFILFLFITSHNPARVNWRPVCWGLLINFILAVIILKTEIGLNLFTVLGEQITKFLSYTDVGSAFVFGHDSYQKHFFAFKVLPTIVFFSCIISLLYYLGVMQYVIKKIAFVMQFTMGTSATESLSCAGNIFVGQTEAPILIRPFLPEMSKSELHAVMTGGFATIAGGVLAAYISIGIQPVHLICASVMNAPMALAVSKLFYPETEKSKRRNKITFEPPSEQNVIEAAASGASQSIMLVANIAANLIAFLALLAFVNAALSYAGSLVDYPALSFEMIVSYILYPVAFLMGVDSQDCLVVAELIGTKIFINEFVAYERLNNYVQNRNLCDADLVSLNARSETIVTYALCGFANLSSIGVQLGGIGAMAPARKKDLASVAIRALIAGTIATLMTACIAGMLINDDTEVLGAECANATVTPPVLDEQCMVNYCLINFNATNATTN